MSKIIHGNDAEALQRWQLSNPQETKAQPGKMITAAQLEELQKQAQEEGYEEGYRQGLSKGEKDIAAAVARLTQVFDALQKPLAELDATVEQELISLALAIAKQVIRREMSTDPSHVAGIVREALSALPLASRGIRVRLHPEDANVIREHMASSREEQGWQVVDDPSVTRGGCMVVTETSQIDASLDKRIAEIAASLLGDQREDDEPDEEN